MYLNLLKMMMMTMMMMMMTMTIMTRTMIIMLQQQVKQMIKMTWYEMMEVHACMCKNQLKTVFFVTSSKAALWKAQLTFAHEGLEKVTFKFILAKVQGTQDLMAWNLWAPHSFFLHHSLEFI